MVTPVGVALLSAAGGVRGAGWGWKSEGVMMKNHKQQKGTQRG